MSENNENNETENKPPVENNSEQKPNEQKPQEKDDLAPIKEKLNSAYSERDKYKEEAETLRKEKRDAEIAALKESGKKDEAYEAQLSDRDQEIEKLKAQIVTLTRDNNVRETFADYKFRNSRAADLAFDQITKELVQDEKGTWVHRSGKTIKDFIKEFSEEEDNKFLFVEKENRGSNITPTPKPNTTTSGKKLKDMTQKEVMELAAKGKLGK